MIIYVVVSERYGSGNSIIRNIEAAFTTFHKAQDYVDNQKYSPYEKHSSWTWNILETTLDKFVDTMWEAAVDGRTVDNPDDIVYTKEE